MLHDASNVALLGDAPWTLAPAGADLSRDAWCEHRGAGFRDQGLEGRFVSFKTNGRPATTRTTDCASAARI
jgi:hypothetical protein